MGAWLRWLWNLGDVPAKPFDERLPGYPNQTKHWVWSEAEWQWKISDKWA